MTTSIQKKTNNYKKELSLFRFIVTKDKNNKLFLKHNTYNKTKKQFENKNVPMMLDELIKLESSIKNFLIDKLQIIVPPNTLSNTQSNANTSSNIQPNIQPNAKKSSNTQSNNIKQKIPKLKNLFLYNQSKFFAKNVISHSNLNIPFNNSPNNNYNNNAINDFFKNHMACQLYSYTSNVLVFSVIYDTFHNFTGIEEIQENVFFRNNNNKKNNNNHNNENFIVLINFCGIQYILGYFDNFNLNSKSNNLEKKYQNEYFKTLFLTTHCYYMKTHLLKHPMMTSVLKVQALYNNFRFREQNDSDKNSKPSFQGGQVISLNGKIKQKGGFLVMEPILFFNSIVNFRLKMALLDKISVKGYNLTEVLGIFSNSMISILGSAISGIKLIFMCMFSTNNSKLNEELNLHRKFLNSNLMNILKIIYKLNKKLCLIYFHPKYKKLLNTLECYDIMNLKSNLNNSDSNHLNNSDSKNNSDTNSQLSIQTQKAISQLSSQTQKAIACVIRESTA